MRQEGGVVPAATSDVRARRHPWAIAGIWTWQTLLALIASWPAASIVRSSYGLGPRGDAPLWDAGGHFLVDFIWHSARGVTATVATAEVVLLIGSIAGLLPTAAAMFAMAYASPDGRAAGGARCLASAVRAMPALVFLLVVMTAAQAIILGIGFSLGAGVEAWCTPGLQEARVQRIEFVIGAVFLVIATGFGVVQDLARAAVVRARVRGPRALVIGAGIFSEAPFPMWWSWAWRALLSLGLVLAGAGLATRVGSRGGVAFIITMALLHQTIVLARIALRTAWLAHALRSVDTACASLAKVDS